MAESIVSGPTQTAASRSVVVLFAGNTKIVLHRRMYRFVGVFRPLRRHIQDTLNGKARDEGAYSVKRKNIYKWLLKLYEYNLFDCNIYHI